MTYLQEASIYLLDVFPPSLPPKATLITATECLPWTLITLILPAGTILGCVPSSRIDFNLADIDEPPKNVLSSQDLKISDFPPSS
jgi:hypothetical protein